MVVENARSIAQLCSLGTCLLLAYGFMKEFRPVVPYLSLYLLNASHANLTDEQLNMNVYPISTYSYMFLLIPAMLVTDWSRYKPVIVTESLALGKLIIIEDF